MNYSRPIRFAFLFINKSIVSYTNYTLVVNIGLGRCVFIAEFFSVSQINSNSMIYKLNYVKKSYFNYIVSLTCQLIMISF